MIITVQELKTLINTEIAENELEMRLSALESAIIKYTNNNFAVRGTMRLGRLHGDTVSMYQSNTFIPNDTVTIRSLGNWEKPYVIDRLNGDDITLTKDSRHEGEVTVSLVQYPDDIKMGVVNLIKWDISNREKIGIKSESISRWTVTYFDLENNSLLSYPSSLLGFLKPYMRGRF